MSLEGENICLWWERNNAQGMVLLNDPVDTGSIATVRKNAPVKWFN